MHAIRQYELGQPEVLRYEEVADLEPTTYDDPERTATMLLGPQMMARPGGLRSLEAEALEKAADGTRVPLVGARFALSDAAGAHRDLEARKTHGEVVLIPDALL